MLTRRSFALSAAASLIAAPALARTMPIVAMPAGYVSPNESKQKDIHDFFTDSESKLGGCCGLADGFMKGAKYRIWVHGTNSRSGRSEELEVFKDLEIRPDGYWLNVFDDLSDKYVWVPAAPKTFVRRPNPTGCYVVWLYHPESVCTVRCFARLTDS